MGFEVKEILFSNDIMNLNFFDKDYIFFHGNMIDERGLSIIEIQSVNCLCKEILFRPKTSEIIINESSDSETIIKSFMLFEYLEELKYENILIDSTTLSVAEILHLLHAYNMSSLKVNIKFMYIEPKEYTGTISKVDGKNIDYELSNNIEGFFDIRPYNVFIDSTNPEDKAEVSVLLGFEEDRLGRIFEFDQNQKFNSFIPIVGLPAFQPGWENISIIKNVRHFNINFKDIEFTGAYNPYQTNNLLEKLYKSSEAKKFVIAALGTKPCAIGAAIFLVNNYKESNNNTGILYDFPSKKNNRTKGISRVFTYVLEKIET